MIIPIMIKVYHFNMYSQFSDLLKKAIQLHMTVNLGNNVFLTNKIKVNIVDSNT